MYYNFTRLYECEISSFTLRDEQPAHVLENKGAGEGMELQKDKEMGGWRTLSCVLGTKSC